MRRALSAMLVTGVALVAVALVAVSAAQASAKRTPLPTNTVSVVGDSITFLAEPAVSATLGADGDIVNQVGLPGWTAGALHPYEVAARRTKPAVLILEMGTNDALLQVKKWGAEESAMFNGAATSRCAVFVDVPRAADWWGAQAAHDTQLTIADQWNARLAVAVAKHPRWREVDWAGAVAADPSLSSDGMHPTDAGSQWLANAYEAAITTCPDV